MARIPDSSFRQWKDGETITGSEYTKEREMLRVANNDNNTRIVELENDSIELHSTQNSMETRLSTVENFSDSGLREDLDAHTTNVDVHLGSIDRTNLTKAQQSLGAHTEGESIKTYDVAFVSNGTSQILTKSFTFPTAFANNTINVVPGQIVQSVPYSDMMYYPFIHLLSKTGFSVKLQVPIGEKFGAGTLIIRFTAIGK